MSTVVETSRLLQYRFFDSARACCLDSDRKITFWLNIYIIAKNRQHFHAKIAVRKYNSAAEKRPKSGDCLRKLHFFINFRRQSGCFLKISNIFALNKKVKLWDRL